MNTINDYMNMPYKMEIVEDKTEGDFVVTYPELPGCVTCGETIESAVRNAYDAKREWLIAAIEDEIEIREPESLEVKMDKLFYPAVFHEAEEGGFWVTFPDVPECMTQGDDMAHAYEMAVEALELAITSKLEEKET